MSRAGHDRHSLRAFQWEQAPNLTAGRVPGADDLGNAVDAEAHHGAGIHAGDFRRFPRHELVDHLGGAHLGHGDRQLAQGFLLVQELADSFLGARSSIERGRSSRHLEPEMGDGRRGDHPRGLEPGRVDPEPVEQGHTVAQEH